MGCQANHFLTRIILEIWISTEENQTVLDPYLGSGSTLIACEQTERVCFGVELDPGYVDVIIQRWENFTGKKAKLIKR